MLILELKLTSKLKMNKRILRICSFVSVQRGHEHTLWQHATHHQAPRWTLLQTTGTLGRAYMLNARRQGYIFSARRHRMNSCGTAISAYALPLWGKYCVSLSPELNRRVQTHGSCKTASRRVSLCRCNNVKAQSQVLQDWHRRMRMRSLLAARLCHHTRGAAGNSRV
jgi:hypothetical protein